jgi:hypothetical protein
MAWTYSGDPASSDAAAVRFLSGDTVQDADVTLTDEEIAFLLSTWVSVYDAAAASCEARAAQYANKASGSKKVGDLTLAIDYEKSAKGLLEMAARLHEQGAREDPPMPWVADAAIQTAAQKDARVPTTEFFTGMFDNRRAVSDG